VKCFDRCYPLGSARNRLDALHPQGDQRGVLTGRFKVA
jgi:hypothetical protein